MSEYYVSRSGNDNNSGDDIVRPFRTIAKGISVLEPGDTLYLRGGVYFFNNIFVAVNPDSDSDRAITFIPSPAFPAQTDGNDYYRVGAATANPYRYLEYTYNDEPPCPDGSFPNLTCRAGSFPNLDALRTSLLFRQSQSQYPPGYEAHSIEENPRFRRIGADGRFRETDDLRLDDSSPAIGAGVRLPDLLQSPDPFLPSVGNPDIGCYPYGSGPLQVGVDGRRFYPDE